MLPKGAWGYPREGAERSKTAQGRSRTPQEPTRDDQNASLRASGSALEALRTRLERRKNVPGKLRGTKNGYKMVTKCSPERYR